MKGLVIVFVVAIAGFVAYNANSLKVGNTYGFINDSKAELVEKSGNACTVKQLNTGYVFHTTCNYLK